MNTVADASILAYRTRTSKYGYGSVDVRATYAHLPCQPFWTWLTGKALPNGGPRPSRATLLSQPQFFAQILWSYSIIVLSIIVAAAAHSIPVSILAIVLVTNRTRGLLHTFHYTTHGASIPDMKLARVVGKYFLSIPILHTTWGEYQKIHVTTHHSQRALCTDVDPDQQFMTAHGFHANMTEAEFWYCTFFKPFYPRQIWNHFFFRFRHNFIIPGWSERAPRIVFWALFFGLGAYFEVLDILALYYLFPLLIVTQYSSWIQHVTEHLWYPKKPAGIDPYVFEASLTWGRFFGRPYPARSGGLTLGHGVRVAVWWAKVFAIDLPCRLFSFMQDLSSHDFHHRRAGVNFWAISQERANSENDVSRSGPMTETWSVLESVLVLRDHLVRGEHDPFGVYAWAAGASGRAQ